jgi:hypothetical protein
MVDISLSRLGDQAIQVLGKQWVESMESEAMEEFLELLLKLMSAVCFINLKGFGENIKGFTGRYLFTSKDKGITVSAVFEDNKMKVSEKVINNPDIIITFRNGKALKEFMLSPKPDILNSMLRQDVMVKGNLNYLYKFAFMAKRLQLMFSRS